MRTRIKVCCIASPAEAAMAVECGADAIGLVGRMPSGPGPIDDELIRRIARLVPAPVETFLLTSETRAEAIADHARRAGTTAVQVVSHIAPREAERLALLLPAIRRVQVIHVESAAVFDLIDAYAPFADAFLLDSGRPGLAVPELGGTGRVHDWSLSAEFVRRSGRPVFLAGGLDAGNVAQAIRTVRPYGVDVCSSLRIAGALDRARLQAFVSAARGC
jgi:phosphoribosylanthranilate isomerase